jgi:hypothetical protein
MLLGFLSLVCGLVLDTVTQGRQELKRLLYLQVPAPLAEAPRDIRVLRTGSNEPSKAASPGH